MYVGTAVGAFYTLGEGGRKPLYFLISVLKLFPKFFKLWYYR